jgi:hypothetical protein
MRDIILLLLIVASGYVASGLIASVFMLLTGRNEYALKPSNDGARLAAVGLTIFTGPAILTTNAIRARAEQPPAYLPIVIAISALWSYVLGLFVVSVALTIPAPF